MNAQASVLEPIVRLISTETGVSIELASAVLAVVEIVVILGVSWVAAIVFKRFVLDRLDRWASATRNDVDDRLVYFVRRFYNFIVFFLVVLVTLQIFGVEITPLLAGAGIAGVAVAYAGKDLLGNMISGVVLLVDQPIRLGDRIQIERISSEWGGWGDVVDIGLRTTTVKNTDGVLVTYPNARLADSILKNFSPVAGPVRFRIRVLVSLENDLEECLEVLEQAARETEGILDVPAPQALVRSLYDDEGGLVHQGAVLELRMWVRDVRVRTVLRSRLLIGIHRAFRARGVQFARLELHPQGGEPRAA